MLLLDFINVGYGDSILIRELRHDETVYTLLVDCGDTEDTAHYERHRISTRDYLRQSGVRHIDTLLLTHLHKDHVGGFSQVAGAFPIRRMVSGYYPPESARPLQEKAERYQGGPRALAVSAEIYLNGLRSMAKEGTERVLLQNASGTLPLTQALSLDYVQGWKDRNSRQQAIFDGLYQPGNPPAEELSELDGYINNLSIVSLLRYGGRRILLPGDVTLSFWEEHPIPEDCVILKLPHHGHRDSFSRGMFQKADPRYVVASVSNERTDDCPSACLPQMLEGRELLFTDAVRLTHQDGVSPRRALRFAISQEGEVSPPVLL